MSYYSYPVSLSYLKYTNLSLTVINVISVCLASIHCLTLKEPTTDWHDDFKNQSDE